MGDGVQAQFQMPDIYQPLRSTQPGYPFVGIGAMSTSIVYVHVLVYPVVNL